MTAVRETYGLRSRIVHGGKSSHKPLPTEETQAVVLTDRLFRRSILTQLLNNLDDPKWKAVYKKARLGVTVSLDTAEWVKK